MIGLIDCESFYCSCERAFRPDLDGRPIIVLSNNDHWIIALSPEAKALGMKRGQRFGDLKAFIEDKNVAYFSSNYTLYNDMSWRFMETLKEFSPVVEPYSIDEAFIDLSGFSNLLSYGEKIRGSVKKYTRLSTTIGIAPTKALAKIAQRLAKKSSGSLLLDSPESVYRALAATDVNDIWGIGASYAGKLVKAGIVTALDFIKVPEWVIRKEMTTTGWMLQRELKGVPMVDLRVSANPRKGIISARQFGEPVSDLTILHEALSYYAELAVEKLLKQKSTTSIITVSLEGNGTARHVTSEVASTCYLPDIISTAKTLLEKIFSPGGKYWRATIFLFGIEPSEGRQVNIFEKKDTRKEHFKEAVHEINNKYGQHTLHPCGSEFREEWGMQRNYLSQNYTTSMGAFPSARISGL